MDWQETDLWKRTLARENDGQTEQPYRERLRVCLRGFRDNASLLADQIPGDLPGLTDHSVRHMDALWDVASLLAAKIPVNPLEAFVFGGAVLLHDLGNSVAAFPNGLAALRGPEWSDIVHTTYRKKFGRPPTTAEINNPDSSLRAEILLTRLRSVHAQQAEALATLGFFLQSDRSGTADRRHLIFDEEIREKLGPLVGKIAHSHHWDIGRVEAEWGGEPFAAPPPFPPNWTIDRLKVAFLLRAADAAQIDSRRAPTLALAIRQPLGESLKHWNFQNHLNRPSIQNERLVYQSYRPFSKGETESWWLCFDVLAMIHRELSRIDDVLLRRRDYRLAAGGVLDHDSAESIQSRITVEGWIPIDARVSIGHVTSIIERLGGERLYGENDPSVPFRELIANAADAVRARRAIENRGSTWGEILVRLDRDNNGAWLEVEDNGIGMSAGVLRGALLEFGTSYWTSSLAQEEHPGLFSKGFTPTGEFGIGFFSIFMLGDRVQIVSQPISRPGTGSPDCHVLEFEHGLSSRPLMRRPDASEWPKEPGTRVRVWLRSDPHDPKGILKPELRDVIGKMAGRLKPEQYETNQLARRAARVAPCLDVDVFASAYSHEPPVQAIAADDWTQIPFDDLLDRIAKPLEAFLGASLDADVFVSDGRPVARLGIPSTPEAMAVIAVGGLKTLTVVPGFPGVILGRSPDLSRDEAEPLPVDIVQIAEWLCRIEPALAARVAKFDRQAFSKGMWYASLYLEAGIRPRKIRGFMGHDGLFSAEEMELSSIPKQVDIVLSDRCRWGNDGDVQLTSVYGTSRLVIREDVIVAPVVKVGWITHYGMPFWSGEILHSFVELNGEPFPWSLPLLCLETIARLQGRRTEEIVAPVTRKDGGLDVVFDVRIGTYAGEDITATVLRIAL